MTAERDRLAALLHDVRVGCHPEGPLFCNIEAGSDRDRHPQQADRLIAAGVHLDEPDLTTAYMVGYEKGRDLGIEAMDKVARADLVRRIEARPEVERDPLTGKVWVPLAVVIEEAERE